MCRNVMTLIYDCSAVSRAPITLLCCSIGQLNTFELMEFSLWVVS